jgi:predicted HD phosphohydrolase
VRRRQFIKRLALTGFAMGAAEHVPGHAAAEGAETHTRMDRWTRQDAERVSAGWRKRPNHSYDQVMALLKLCDTFEEPGSVSQMVHCLQTATRAVRAKADGEWVVAALFHDVGKVYSGINHAAIIAEILRPHVSDEVYEVVRNHIVFEARFYGKYFEVRSRGSQSPHCDYPAYACYEPEAYKRFAGRSWYPTAMQFTEEWDQLSFDPKYETFPIAYFAPVVKKVMSKRTFSLGLKKP